MKIAHIASDEKFTDCAISLFSELECVENFFYIYSKSNDLKYVKKNNIFICKKISHIINQINDQNIDVVILHSKFIKTKEILKLNKSIILIWSSWGYDLYSDSSIVSLDRFLIPINLYLPITRKYVKMHPKEYLFSKIKNLFENFFQINKFLNRIDYISTVLEYEYFILKKNKKITVPYFPFKYIQKNCGQLEIDLYKRGRSDILIGNSSTPICNHLDALSTLYFSGINNFDKIIIPLNYGSVSYSKYIINTANRMFPSKIISIKSFLPYDSYVSMLSNCKAFIITSIRQHAIGNIEVALLYGIRIFVSVNSLMYKSFIKDGYIIYTIENDINIIESEVSVEEINHNRNLYLKNRNYDSVLKDVQFFFNNLKISK